MGGQRAEVPLAEPGEGRSQKRSRGDCIEVRGEIGVVLGHADVGMREAFPKEKGLEHSLRTLSGSSELPCGRACSTAPPLQ